MYYLHHLWLQDMIPISLTLYIYIYNICTHWFTPSKQRPRCLVEFSVQSLVLLLSLAPQLGQTSHLKTFLVLCFSSIILSFGNHFLKVGCGLTIPSSLGQALQHLLVTYAECEDTNKKIFLKLQWNMSYCLPRRRRRSRSATTQSLAFSRNWSDKPDSWNMIWHVIFSYRWLSLVAAASSQSANLATTSN